MGLMYVERLQSPLAREIGVCRTPRKFRIRKMNGGGDITQTVEFIH